MCGKACPPTHQKQRCSNLDGERSNELLIRNSPKVPLEHPEISPRITTQNQHMLQRLCAPRLSSKSFSTLSNRVFSPIPAALRSRLPRLRPLRFTPVRTYYGHISDDKMAPQLEPYFKKYIRTINSLDTSTNTFAGSTNWPNRLLTVSISPLSQRRGIDACTGLRKAVAIPSVSAEDDRRKDVVRVCCKRWDVQTERN